MYVSNEWGIHNSIFLETHQSQRLTFITLKHSIYINWILIINCFETVDLGFINIRFAVVIEIVIELLLTSMADV